MTIRRTSAAGWRTTFVDTLALSFVFLILLARPPAPHDQHPAAIPVSAPSLPKPTIGMLASSLRHAVSDGRLATGEVISRGHEVSVTLPLPGLAEAHMLDPVRAVAGLAAAHGPAMLEIVLLLPDRPDDAVFGSLAAMALQVPASWLVQVAAGRPRLRMTVGLVRG